MHVAILCWEVPPIKVGDISRHVSVLANGLATRGIDVSIITYQDTQIELTEGTSNVKIYRVSNPVKAYVNILTWALTLNQEFVRTSSDLYYSDKIDVIDVYEWLCVPAAVSLKRSLRIPFVFSIHSLERQRSGGRKTPLNLAIEGLEGLGTSECEVVIVESEWMKEEVSKIYQLSPRKIRVIPPYSRSWIDDTLRVYEECIGKAS